jgi:nuclear RNA export factor
LKLNGFTFVGTPINITEAPEGMPGHAEPALSATSQELKTRLIQVLSNRYDANAKLLNLSKLGEDPELIQMGFFNGESKPQKLFQALMAICDSLFKSLVEKREALTSISLAGNNIDDVLQIMSLADTLPDLINLDLSFNQFKDLKGLRKWNHRLRNLQTLLLNDNPIEVAEPTYKSELTKWFPKLQNLSGTQVRTPEQVAVIETAAKVSPIPQAGADFRDINRVGEGFITEFIQMYDADRQGLANKYYDEQSSFSLAVNNRAPHPPDMQPPSWTAYIKLSRNHVRITNPPSRYQRLFTGTGLIQAAWQKLPPTRHPDLATQFDKYIIDCHPISGLADPTGQSAVGVDGMIMTFHGEFEDQDPDTKSTAMRGFSRTILLGPGAPGRNPIRVISDLLSLRAYNPLPQVSAPAAPAPPVAPAVNVDAQKQQILAELCKQTGMTPEYSTMCLDVAGWNFDQALLTFNEKRVSAHVPLFYILFYFIRLYYNANQVFRVNFRQKLLPRPQCKEGMTVPFDRFGNWS